MKYILTISLLLLMIVIVFTETIYEVQYTTSASGDSPLVGQTVTVTGIITRIFGTRHYFIQDASAPWHGVMIYDNPTDIKVGDSIQVTGVVQEYYNKTEISSISSYTILASGCEVPAPIIVHTGDIDSTNTSISEQYEGVLVKLENPIVQTAQNSYSEWEVDDGTGNCIIDESTDAPYTYSPTVGDTLKYIVGVVDYDYSNYKIFPAGDEDILKSINGSGKALINPKYANVNDTLNLRLDIIATVDTSYGFIGYERMVVNADTLDSVKVMAGTEYLDTTLYSVDYSGTNTIIAVNYQLLDTVKIYLYGYVFTQEDSFVVYTGESAGTFDYISSLPYIKELPEMDIMDIAEVQKTYDGYNSIYNNQTVTVKGVVTGPSSIFSPTSTSTGFWIMDNTGGINIYSSNDPVNSSFTLGMEIIITGTITEYGGVTELKYSDPNTDIIVLNDTIANVEPVLLNNSEGINELNEGSFVRAEYAKIATAPVDAGSGKNFQVYNGLTLIDVRMGDKTDAYSDPDFLSLIQPGKIINVQGIAGQYDTEEPYSSGYQLLIRYESDIEFLESEEDSGYNVYIYPNPVNFDNGEVARIEIGALNSQRITARILDLKSREIVKLVENVPGPQTIMWDGKDYQGRKVNIGAYVLIVDYTDNTGFIKRVNKPIIITTQF